MPTKWNVAQVEARGPRPTADIHEVPTEGQIEAKPAYSAIGGVEEKMKGTTFELEPFFMKQEKSGNREWRILEPSKSL